MKSSSLRAQALAAVVASVPLLVGGCSHVGGDLPAIWLLMKGIWTTSPGVSLQEAAAVPYASIGVRLGDSNEIILVLATDDRGSQLWTSSQRIAIITQNGRVTRTAGLEHNLGGIQVQAANRTNAAAFTWLADFPDLSLYAVPITCRQMKVSDETITILGKEIQTRRVEERCASDSDSLDWSFKNTFWRDPQSGMAWKSTQHFHPNSPPLTIQTLRPVAD